MAHYAYLDQNNIVTQVIVGKDENDGHTDWEEYYGAVRTSYNTQAASTPTVARPSATTTPGSVSPLTPTSGPTVLSSHPNRSHRGR